MKKICLSFLLMFILTLICGCSNAMGDNSSKYKCDAISEGVYCLDENTSSVYPYENKFYHVNYENGNIGYSEPETMEYHLLCTLDKDTLNDVYVDIYVDDTGIYVSGDYVVYVIDFDGNIIDQIELPNLGAYWYSQKIYISLLFL